MSITVDKEIATGLLGKASTGDELLSILNMIVDNFTGAPVPDAKSNTVTPTLEEIEF